MKTAEEFFRQKLKEVYPFKEVITLANEMITAEQGMRWAHEFTQLNPHNISSNFADMASTPITKQKKQFTPPTFLEVVCYFKLNGYNEIGAKKAYSHYNDDGADWKDSNGKRVVNWKQKMRTNWFRDEYKREAKQPDQVVSFKKVL